MRLALLGAFLSLLLAAYVTRFFEGQHGDASDFEHYYSVLIDSTREYLQTHLPSFALVTLRARPRFASTWTLDPRARCAPMWDSSELEKKCSQDKELLLVVLGEIFDVSRGGQDHYAEGKGYDVFVGRDATASFVTGDFSVANATDDLSRFTLEQFKQVKYWVDFYRRHPTYQPRGCLIGRFYDRDGRRTDAWRFAAKNVLASKESDEIEEILAKRYPHCNTRWTSEVGTTIWCEDSRVPRLFRPGPSLVGIQPRCVCVQGQYDPRKASYVEDSTFQVYEGCEETAASCALKRAKTSPT